MIKSATLMAIATSLATAACGGESGEPLIGSTLVLQFASESYTPVHGVAGTTNGTAGIAFGTGPLNCDSFTADEPPAGTNAVFTVDAFAPGTYSPPVVQVLQNEGSFLGVGSSGGSVTLTSVTETSVAGSIAFTYTDDDDGLIYSANGTFEVVRCP